MGKTKSQPETTPKKEPQPAAVPRVDKVQAALTEMSWQVALPFMAFVLGGNWLDGRYASKPTFTIAGLALGVAAVIVAVRNIVGKYYPNTVNKDDK